MHEVEKRIIFWPDLTRTLSNFMKGSGLMKKKIIITTLVILFVVIFCVAVALWFNPNLNKFKLKSVEKNALEYIHQTYPEFEVDDILVRHEWKSNHYVVEYSDGKGDIRTVIFDHTGEELFVDEYIDREAWKIVNAYESSIEKKIDAVLKNILGEYSTSYIIIDDIKAHGKEREIALEGLDISSDSVECSIGIMGGKDETTLEFAKISKEIYVAVSSLGLPIDQIKIHQQNSPDSRYDIVCPANMDKMSIEEIDKLLKK